LQFKRSNALDKIASCSKQELGKQGINSQNDSVKSGRWKLIKGSAFRACFGKQRVKENRK
jgi:hypothetical protein